MNILDRPPVVPKGPSLRQRVMHLLLLGGMLSATPACAVVDEIEDRLSVGSGETGGETGDENMEAGDGDGDPTGMDDMGSGEGPDMGGMDDMGTEPDLPPPLDVPDEPSPVEVPIMIDFSWNCENTGCGTNADEDDPIYEATITIYNPIDPTAFIEKTGDFGSEPVIIDEVLEEPSQENGGYTFRIFYRTSNVGQGHEMEIVDENPKFNPEEPQTPQNSPEVSLKHSQDFL